MTALLKQNTQLHNTMKINMYFAAFAATAA